MELTKEQVEKIVNGKIDSRLKVSNYSFREMAKQLLAEMDKPRVWDGSPDYAGRATVTFEKGGSDNTTIWSKVYTRTITKSRIDEIAEEAQSSFLDGTNKPLTEVIKSAIIRALEEKEAER